MKNKQKMSQIGIFSGTFDPVHIGHIAFALRAIEKVKLDKVVFLPEPRPRHKSDVTDYKHRLNMLNLAIKSFDKLDILDLRDNFFSVGETLPKLQANFKNDQLFLMVGSDVAKNITHWEGIGQLFKNSHLIIGTRHRDSQQELEVQLQKLLPDSHTYFIRTRYPKITSTNVRLHLADDVDPEVLKYIHSNQLYKA